MCFGIHKLNASLDIDSVLAQILFTIHTTLVAMVFLMIASLFLHEAQWTPLSYHGDKFAQPDLNPVSPACKTRDLTTAPWQLADYKTQRKHKRHSVITKDTVKSQKTQWT